ncbi:MAG: ABC transporter permease [Chitinophagaceae bacterium]
MLRNFLKIAFRNLSRNKGFSFINIFGLAVGLATCLLIMIYIFDESGYDKQHKDGDRLFRVASVVGTGETWAALPGPVSWAMKNDLPEVEQVARIMTFPDIENLLLKYEAGSETKQFFETHGYYVDSTFFQLFTYDFTYGDPSTALNEPNTMVISDEIAHKLFGSINPVGKLINVNTAFGLLNYTVKGVFSKARQKSHIPANYFLSMRNNDMWNWVKNQTSWATNNVFFTYVKLKKDVTPSVFDKKLKTFFERHAGEALKAAGFSKTVFVQAVKDIYLHSSIGNEIGSNGSITYLYILGSIAAFILIIACINFMNLATARSEKRAREVGVRKVIGASKGSLITQFLGESFIMCLLSLVLALVMACIFLPLFNNLVQKDMHPFERPVLIVWVVGLALLTGLLAGIYPAFYLSAFKPVSVLKGRIANSFSASAIRKGLVVFQFTISICLVLGAIIIWQQLDLLKNQHLGFNKDQQLVIPLQLGYNNTSENYTALRNELIKDPHVKMVTSGSTYPGIPSMNSMLFYPEGKTVDAVTSVHLSAVNNDYIETLGFSLLHGRTFTKEFTSDSASIILNESAVKALGYEPGTAVGKKIQFDLQGNHLAMQIVGVVKDFNYESLHTTIKPFGFTTTFFAVKYNYAIATVSTKDYAGLLKNLGKVWSKISPNTPFIYSFLDQDFQRNYEKEQRTSSIVVYFTFIAILIACMGLFGLAAFSAEQRRKEIGIRKVLGASVTSAAVLLSKDFVRLIIVAIIIASPIAWYAMNQWLQDFAYRIHISWWMFVVAGCLAVLIALATVSFQAIRAAVMNPVKSLRTE